VKYLVISGPVRSGVVNGHTGSI